MTISGGRTKQLDIFRHVTGFTSFIVVKHIHPRLGWVKVRVRVRVGFWVPPSGHIIVPDCITYPCAGTNNNTD